MLLFTEGAPISEPNEVYHSLFTNIDEGDPLVKLARVPIIQPNEKRNIDDDTDDESAGKNYSSGGRVHKSNGKIDGGCVAA